MDSLKEFPTISHLIRARGDRMIKCTRQVNIKRTHCLYTLNRDRTICSFVAMLPLIQLWRFPGAMSHCETAVRRKFATINKKSVNQIAHSSNLLKVPAIESFASLKLPAQLSSKLPFSFQSNSFFLLIDSFSAYSTIKSS